MDIYTWAILLSVLVYIAVGNYAGRRVKRLDDYFVAGRRAPTLLIIGTLIASMLSTNAFLGETGFVYDGQAGPYLLWPPISAMGYVYGALFFGRYLRRSRALTVADYFGKRFNSRRVQSAAGVTIILGLGGYLLAVTQGAALLLSELTPLSYLQGLLVSWVSYTLFTMYSGSRGVVLTDTLMFLLFSSMTVAALLYMLDNQGGWVTTVENLSLIQEKAGMMSWHGIIGGATPWETVTDYVAWGLIIGIGWSLVYAVSPWQSSRYLIARNEHTVMRAACLATLIIATLQLTLYLASASVNLSKLDIRPPEEAMIWAAKNLMPELMGALLLAGIMAAALSSASTFLSLVGFSVSNDVVNREHVEDKHMLRLSRWSMLAVGIVVLAVSFFVPPNIFWLTYFVGTLFASSWAPVALLSVWSRRITANAAFWGIISGFVFNAVPKALEFFEIISLSAWADPILLGGLVSLVVVVLVSRRSAVSAEEEAYRQGLHVIPNEETDPAKMRFTLATSAALVVYGVFMSVVLITIYVRPYQEATGRLLADGSLDWATGEAILALGWAILIVPMGLMAWRVIKKSYA